MGGAGTGSRGGRAGVTARGLRNARPSRGRRHNENPLPAGPPNLRPVVFAQFLVLLPAFVLTEATLSLLGLGVAEPLPSWGVLLRGLEDPTAIAGRPWKLVPLLLLLLTTASLQILATKKVHSK